jgi:hypothetical protein
MQAEVINKFIIKINISIAWPHLLWNVNPSSRRLHHLRLTSLCSVSAWTWSATLLQSCTAAYSWGAFSNA